jgi:hypothetical protein
VPFSRALQRIFKHMGRRQGKCNDRQGAKANVSILVSQSQLWQQTMPRCASASMDRSASLIWKMRIMA